MAAVGIAVRVGEAQTEVETVELGFRRGVRPVLFDGFCVAMTRNGWGKGVGPVVHRYLPLGSSLRAGRSGPWVAPVDLVGEDDVGEERPGEKTNDFRSASRMCMPMMSWGRRSLVNWIRRKVPGSRGEGPRQRRFSGVRDVLEENYASRDERGDRQVHRLPFPRGTVSTFARRRQQVGERFPFHGIDYPQPGGALTKSGMVFEWIPAFPLGRRNAGRHRPRRAAPGRCGGDGTVPEAFPDDGEGMRLAALGSEPADAERRRRWEAVLELARRALSVPRRRPELFRSRRTCSSVPVPALHSPVEVFVVVLLDVKHRPLREERVLRGSSTAASSTRERFSPRRSGERAAAVLLLHNHPSGDPAPSGQDREVTRRLRSAGGSSDPVVDHVILGDAAFFSFREEGDW